MPRKRTPYFIKWPSNVFTRPKYVNSCADLGRNALIECSEKDPATLPDELTQLLKINSGESLIDNFYLYRDETDPTEKLKLWVNIFATLQILRPYFEDIDTRMSAPEFSDFFLNAFSDLKTWTEQYKDAADIKEIANRDFLGLPAGGKSRTAADSFFNSLSAAEREEIAETHNLEKLETVSDLAGLSLEVIDRIKNGYDPKFFNIPNSEQSNLIERALSAGSDNFPEMAIRLMDLSHGKKDIAIGQDDNGNYIIKQSTENTETKIIIEGFSEILRGNKNTKKFFDFSMAKVNERINKNELQEAPQTPQTIPVYVDLEELVASGMYSSLRAARRGFDEGTAPLDRIKLEYKQTGKTSAAGWARLFSSIERHGNMGVFYVFKSPVWGTIFETYAYMPQWAFALSLRGYDLFRLILSRARINGNKLNENGYIDISLRMIQAMLCLPNENGAINPQRDIKLPIEKAIEDIEETGNTTNLQFELLPAGIDEKSIKEYLDKGFLRVYMSGKYLNTFSEMAKKRTRIIKNKSKSKARAIAKNAEKKTESKD